MTRRGFLNSVLIASGCVVAISACSGKAQFASKAGRLIAADQVPVETQPTVTSPTPKDAPAVVLPTPKPEVTFVETPTPTAKPSATEFDVSAEVRSSVNGREAWVVVADRVHRIDLDESRGFPTMSWAMPANQGNRTYVSEIGLLIGRTARSGRGGIFRAGLNVPGGFEAILTEADLGMSDASRMCVTSFRVGNISYIGGAYNGNQDPSCTSSCAVSKKFIKIPIDITKPKGVDLAAKQIFDLGVGGAWGYSCFIDQARGYFWSDHTGRHGVNVATGAPVDVSLIPNATRTTSDITSFSLRPVTRASYAMAGDSSGNILSASGVYTFAHDPTSHYVFGSKREGEFWLTHDSCFSGDALCAAHSKHFSFDATAVGKIGPLSALNDGTVVGISRSAQNGSSKSLVYLVSLKDSTNASLGVNFRKIAEIPGDAYMYTDFTGATLYAAHVEKTFDLKSSPDFRPGQAIEGAKLVWRVMTGADPAWQGLIMKYRCYAASSATKPDWKTLTPVASAGTATPLDCSGVFDSVDVMIDGDGVSSAFSRIGSIEILGRQP